MNGYEEVKQSKLVPDPIPGPYEYQVTTIPRPYEYKGTLPQFAF